MDWKVLFSIAATIIGILAFFPYLRDVFARRTHPHAYTWLIWSITQSTAVIGILYGGGSWGALSLAVATLFVIAVFLFSLKYGTRNITRSDAVTLTTAILAILVWWQLERPLLSVIMVSVIDVTGYIPSFRKSYQEPWSETMSSWIAFSVSNTLAVLALKEYSLLTMTYLVAITSADLCLFMICFLRRPFVPNPQPSSPQ